MLDKPPSSQPIEPGVTSSEVPFQLFNIGSGRPVSVNRLVSLIEDSLGKKAVIEFKPQPAEDMQITHADIQNLEDMIGTLQTTRLEDGINQFVTWYCSYHNSNS